MKIDLTKSSSAHPCLSLTPRPLGPGFALALAFAFSLILSAPAPAACPCSSAAGFDNFCAYPPSTANCPMTFPFGYCDPNGDRSYTDGDWVRGYNEYAAACRAPQPSCRCVNGVDYFGRAIDPNSTFCGYRVCGRDNQNYECRAAGWVGIGGSPCAGSSCRCTGGTDYWGRAVDPNATYCGYRVCGRDNQNYECRATGWIAVGGSPCAGPPTTCRCEDGEDFWGRIIDPNSTSCGLRVCGRDDQFYECRTTGWTAVGGAPCHSSAAALDCFGLGINANGPLGAPTPAELDALGVRWVRTLVRENRPTAPATWNTISALGAKIARTLPSADRPRVLVIFNQESFASRCGDPGAAPPGTCSWVDYRTEYSNAILRFIQAHDAAVSAYEIWNEPDLAGFANSTDYRDFLAFVVPRVRAATTKPILLSAPAGPNWITYLQALSGTLSTLAASYDGLSFHPYFTSISGVDYVYAGRPTLDATITQAYNLQPSPRKPLWITEFGIPLGDIAIPVPAPPAVVATEVQALYLARAYSLFAQLGPNVVAHAFWFAWSDNVHSLGGSPAQFGLVSANLTRRSAWEAYRRCAKLGTCPTSTAGLAPAPAPAPTRCPCAFYDPAIDNYCFYPPVGRGAVCPGLTTTLCPGLPAAPNYTSGAINYQNACWTCTDDSCAAR